MIKYIFRFFAVCFWVVVIYTFLKLPDFLKDTEHHDNILRVYSWAHRMDESILKDFEKETGIKIYLKYYESSEELLTKLEMMSPIDCDIMLPSGYIIEPMIKAGILKKLDYKKCSFIKNIYPEFLNMYFDPNNQYSLPLYWDIFGIGYNQNIVQNQPISLKLLFDQPSIIDHEVGMSEDAREAIFLGASYLGFDPNNISDKQLEIIYNLLCKQKKWVGSYSDSQQGYYLSSDTFAVVVSDRETICREMLKHSNIKFALIPSGSMLRTDSIVISANTKKEDLVYKFVNYLFSAQVLLYHCQKYCILPTTKDTFTQLDKKYIGLDTLYPGSRDFKKLIVFKHNLTQKEINDFWIRFKAS